MGLIEHIRYRMRQAAWPAVIVTLLAYFAFHSINGHYGLLALRDLNLELATLEVEAAVTADVRARLEARVAQLRDDNLDPDLLGERARAVLGFARRDEIVIFTYPEGP